MSGPPTPHYLVNCTRAIYCLCVLVALTSDGVVDIVFRVSVYDEGRAYMTTVLPEAQSPAYDQLHLTPVPRQINGFKITERSDCYALFRL